ncbi:MAG: hypothetical protein Q4C64_00580 [Erysipelotrichia bacterium]|nr:hypothetical protein [Erysipelotrichia bacterium]
MNKKLLILISALCLLFTGCDSQNINKEIQQAENRAISADIGDTSINNCQKKYYSYYLHMNIGRVSSDEISNIFKINGNIASMSLDITSIVNNSILLDSDEYTIRDIGTLDNAIYSNLSRYTDSSGQSIPYKLSIAPSDDNKYFVMIQTGQFIFVASAAKDSCAQTIYDMFLLLRSCQVESKQLMLDYASDSIITYSTNIITLFEDILPESGYLIDYVDNWKNDTTFVKIDNRPSADTVIGEDSGSDINDNIDEEGIDYGKIDRQN